MDKLLIYCEQAGLSLDRGKIKSPTGRNANISKLYSEYCTSVTDAAQFVPQGSFEQTLKDVLQSRQDETASDHHCEFPTVHSEFEFIDQAAEEHGFVISPRGDEIQKGPDTIPLDIFQEYVLFHLSQYRQDSPKDARGKPTRRVWSLDEMQRAITIYTQERDTAYRSNLRTNLQHDPADAEYTQSAMDYLLHAFELSTDRALGVRVLSQWLWQTKRYLYGNTVTDPLFLNLLSQHQGVGKTYLINRLAEPWDGFFIPDAKLHQVKDSREAGRWCDNYIAFFDELSLGGGDGTSGAKEIFHTISNFKSLLTQTHITYRMMRKHKQARVKRTFSPIGASNTPLIHIVYDPTGMRRFYELELNVPQETAPILDIGKLDPVRLWRGIDENLPKGYIYDGSEGWQDMRAVQKGYKRMDLVEMALSEIDYGEVPVDVVDMVDQAADIEKLAAAGDTTTLAAQYSVVLVPPYKLRKKITEWISDEAGRDLVSYIPHHERFLLSLQKQGKMIVNTPQSRKIVCKTVTTSNTGLGI